MYTRICVCGDDLIIIYPYFPITDGLNISQTSLVLGGGRVPNNTGGFIQVGSSTDLREQRRVLEEGRDVPFTKWDFRLIMAWMEAEMGKVLLLG